MENKPAESPEIVPYRSYLLRLWPVQREGLASIRVSIDDVATGERRDFPDLESLFNFLTEGQEGEDVLHPGQTLTVLTLNHHS